MLSTIFVFVFISVFQGSNGLLAITTGDLIRVRIVVPRAQLSQLVDGCLGIWYLLLVIIAIAF